jgi:hypothetical protein
MTALAETKEISDEYQNKYVEDSKPKYPNDAVYSGTDVNKPYTEYERITSP